MGRKKIYLKLKKSFFTLFCKYTLLKFIQIGYNEKGRHMGEKPNTLIEVPVDHFIFNKKTLNRLLIDLDHINKGKSKNEIRSSLTTDDVVNFALCLNGLVLEPIDKKYPYNYFSLDIQSPIDGKMNRIVFLTENKEDYLGIITLYRISKKGVPDGISKKK